MTKPNGINDNPHTSTGLDNHVLTFPEDHEYIWPRVVRERKEGHKKFLGSRRRETPSLSTQNGNTFRGNSGPKNYTTTY